MVKPDVDVTLAAEWLQDLPGYRELIRQRVSDEQRRRYRREGRMNLVLDNKPDARKSDVDNLGREVEGCG